MPPILEGFPYLQAHNFLTCDQPDPKDKFFTNKKKYEKVQHFDQNFRDGPLKRSASMWPTLVDTVQATNFVCNLR